MSARPTLRLFTYNHFTYNLLEEAMSETLDAVSHNVNLSEAAVSKVKALLESLGPYGVKEIVQSGAVAITRGPRSITDQLKEK